ncbi:MAG TPA: hypothetical protein VHZ96_26305 [Frankiaceae bacterium]|jgi:hypothetical protein|nr:hypothetical protein [Frankiaceae bacterium]
MVTRNPQRASDVTALLAAITQAAQQADDTFVSEGEARRWSPVVDAAQKVREASE